MRTEPSRTSVKNAAKYLKKYGVEKHVLFEMKLRAEAKPALYNIDEVAEALSA